MIRNELKMIAMQVGNISEGKLIDSYFTNNGQLLIDILNQKMGLENSKTLLDFIAINTRLNSEGKSILGEIQALMAPYQTDFASSFNPRIDYNEEVTETIEIENIEQLGKAR